MFDALETLISYFSVWFVLLYIRVYAFLQVCASHLHLLSRISSHTASCSFWCTSPHRHAVHTRGGPWGSGLRLSGFTYLIQCVCECVCICVCECVRAWQGLREAQLKVKRQTRSPLPLSLSSVLFLSPLHNLFLPSSLFSPSLSLVAQWWMADCRGEGGGVCDQQPGLSVFVCVFLCVCVCEKICCVCR